MFITTGKRTIIAFTVATALFLNGICALAGNTGDGTPIGTSVAATMGTSVTPYGVSDSIYPEHKAIDAAVSYSEVDVVLNESDIARVITIHAPSLTDAFYEDFDLWTPGNQAADTAFTIQNNTGRSFQVVDFEFSAEAGDFRRTYNEAAKNKFGSYNMANRTLAAALSPDEWYQLNANFYGIDSDTPYDRELLHKILALSGGDSPAYVVDYNQAETSPEMIELTRINLFYRFLFSFDNDIHTVTGLDSTPEDNSFYDSPFFINNYLNGAVHETVLSDVFDEPIGQDGFSSILQLANDGRHIGNSYQLSDMDFSFTLTLKLLPQEPGPGPDPGPDPDPDPKPGPDPDPDPKPNPDPDPDPKPNPDPDPKPNPDPDPDPKPNPDPDPDPKPNPDPDPDPKPNPDPKPKPDPGSKPNPDTKDKKPGSNIPDVHTRDTAPQPDAPTITIEEPDIPLRDNPYTGTNSLVKTVTMIGILAFAAGSIAIFVNKNGRSGN